MNNPVIKINNDINRIKNKHEQILIIVLIILRYTLVTIWILQSVKRNIKKFEDTKMVVRSHKSEDRQYNGQKKKDKSTNNDL